MCKPRFTFVSALALCCLLLAACQPERAKIVPLGPADGGKTIQIRPGDRLNITLPGNPTTGYNWEAQPAPDPSVLRQAGEPQFVPDNQNTAGSGGNITLQFDAQSPGQTGLVLIYHRAWEQGVAPLETYQVTVEVVE